MWWTRKFDPRKYIENDLDEDIYDTKQKPRKRRILRDEEARDEAYEVRKRD